MTLVLPEIHLHEPLALALALPAVVAWWWWAASSHARWWRLTTLLLLVFAATRPELAWGRGGSDVILVLDRSASMGDARDRQEELVRLVAEQRRSGDRLGVVLAGDGSAIAQGPQHTGIPHLDDTHINDGGSDLALALEQAVALVAPGRSARVILHSDGEATGAEPRPVAARLALAGIPLDVLPERRPPLPDAAVLDLELPRSLRLGESFIGAVRFISDADEERSYRISRDGREIAHGSVRLTPFTPVTATFADRPSRTGLASYVVDLGTVEHSAGAALRQRLRDLAGSPLLAGIVEQLPVRGSPIDPKAVIAQLETLTRRPEVQAMLDRLAEPGPAQQAAIESIAKLAEKQGGALLAGLVRQTVTSLLASDPAAGADRDRQPLNNHARAGLRVSGGEQVMVMSGDGTPGNVARALQAAGMRVITRAEGPLALDDLLGISTLVLDQVPADRLGAKGLEAVARWVEHLGGGLVMGGGRRGFGCGGYHKSAVERVLPVTMELRDEHRKLAVAMAITLDRSGSMSVATPSGKPKMDLANEGAAATIELLGARDQVAVHAVDSEPHVVVPLTYATDAKALVNRVLGIRSQGGGIYVYQALLGAGQELLAAKTGTRHIVLFADANDAEEPGDYIHLLDDYLKAGITVSVVAMGNANDQDAKFLEDVAKRGNGRIAYAEAPEDIPRLFAQETVLVARSAWISDPVVPVAKPALDIELGRLPTLAGAWPTVSGYNLTYARDAAQVLALAPGDPAAPAVATWRIGGGRAVAIALNLDDPKSPALLGWGGYAPLLASLVRWAAGGDGEAPGMLAAEQTGRTVALRLELDPARRAEWPAQAPQVVLNLDGELQAPRQVTMQPIDDGRYEAIVRLDDQRTLLPSVTLNGRTALGPALSLPYSPEAEPRFGQRPGNEVLDGLARDTNGTVRTDLLAAFANPPSPGELVDATMLVLIAALVLAVAEILIRRLRVGWPGRRAEPSATTTAQPAPAPAPTPAVTAVTAVTAPAPIAPGAPEADRGLHEALRQLRRKP